MVSTIGTRERIRRARPPENSQYDLKVTMPDISRRVFSSLLLSASGIVAGDEPAPSLGNLFTPILGYASAHKPAYSFLDAKFRDVDEWKRAARATYRAHLAYAPPTVPFDARVMSTDARDGYVQESLLFRTSPFSGVPALLLKPDRPLAGKPGLIALHDHGGFYYFGKEKVTDNKNEPAVLTEFKRRTYGGSSFASDFARAGFSVLVIDAFYFGGRRLDPSTLPAGRADSLKTLIPGTDAYIAAYNELAGSYESLTAKTIFLSGATWPGMILWDDLRSVEYLKTRSEVNPNRIGCIGFSGGGLRAATLCGMHPSVRSTVVCCFMSTATAMLRGDVEHHAWMMYVPGVFELLDLPDIASMTAPNHLLVQYGRKDALFNEAGQRDSAGKLTAVFRKARCADHFRASFYDAPHGFSTEMQAEALRWLKDTLS